MRVMYNLALNLWNLSISHINALRGYLLQENGDYLLLEDGDKLGI